jgi:hypothetical protein
VPIQPFRAIATTQKSLNEGMSVVDELNPARLYADCFVGTDTDPLFNRAWAHVSAIADAEKVASLSANRSYLKIARALSL